MLAHPKRAKREFLNVFHLRAATLPLILQSPFSPSLTSPLNSFPLRSALCYIYFGFVPMKCVCHLMNGADRVKYTSHQRIKKQPNIYLHYMLIDDGQSRTCSNGFK